MAASTHFLILILVFLVQLLLALANVKIGSTLSTNGNNAWVSASSEFAFGFHQINGTSTSTSTSTFILAIWYHQIPDKTIIWHAVKTPNNDKDPVEAPQGSQLGLTAQGLILTNPQNESIWTAAQPTNVIVSSAAMLDSGNFVLLDAESNNVWESFQNPTDTLLPSQSLQLSATLTSRLTQTNFTIGRFQLYFKDGNVFLSPLAWPSTNRYKSYYKIDASGSASRLAFDNTTGNIYVVATNGTKLQTPQDTTWQKNITYDPTSYYYRVTLEYHGVLTQYSHPRDSSSNGWSIKRYVPDDICTAIFNETGSGACGYNSYCSMENQIPTCTCPQGFSLVDQSNQYAGCQSNFTFICGVDGVGSQQELYQLPESAYINFPLGDYAILAPYSQQECQQSCLQDCICGVVVYNADEKTCWKKSLPLINGIKQENNPLVSIFVKRTVTNYHHDDCNKAKKVFLGSLIGSLLVNSILIASVVFFVLLLKSKTVGLDKKLLSFTYEELNNATNGFSKSNILGKGGFGIVYKCKLRSSLVAVKKLNESKEEGEKDVDFKTELTAIAKPYHKNLVRLIGYCDEGSHRILVYEFMSNGTLGEVLFGKVKHKSKWSVRVGYALGIARGLVYLHEECDAPVMHCDIKPDNVLIDEDLNAKISDFGLAKLLSRNQIATNTVIRGTPGYVAPEWYHEVPVVTTKVDVYSFGVVLLEIICCIKNVLPVDPKQRKDAILDPVYMKVRIDYLMENDEEAKADSGRVMKWIKIAMKCIQENPTDRPTMKMVMQMLEEDVNHSSHD